MENGNLSGSAVVARFTDGRVVKGTTHDFAPHKTSFHLCVVDDPSAKALVVPLGALKALFFVRTFQGNPKYVDNLALDDAKGPGRKIVVTFADGEVICGLTSGYSKDKPGFFVVPVDPKGNNSRIFVVAASVKSIAWGDAPVPVRTTV